MNKIYRQLSLEKKAIILTSRIQLSESNKNDLIEIISDPMFNWFDFIKYALFHKTLILATHNLTKSIPKVHIPKYLLDICNYISYCTQIRNMKNQDEIFLVQTTLENYGIKCIPVKGAYLIPNLYQNYAVRFSGDIDFLIRYKDTNQLDTLLFDLGYRKGRFDYATNEIVAPTRAKIVKWKAFMSNLYPYYKLSQSELFPYFKLDFRYALDDSLNKEPINEIITQFTHSGKVMPSHYLVHLCTHFYDEVKHDLSKINAKGLNLIKFCDIREFIRRFCKSEDIENAICFAKRHKLEHALAYTMTCLKAVYNDGYEASIIESLDSLDSLSDFVNDSYFFDKLFSCVSYEGRDQSKSSLDFLKI